MSVTHNECTMFQNIVASWSLLLTIRGLNGFINHNKRFKLMSSLYCEDLKHVEMGTEEHDKLLSSEERFKFNKAKLGIHYLMCKTNLSG